MHGRFLAGVLAGALVPFGLILLLGYAILVASGEQYSARRIVQIEEATPGRCLYGSGIADRYVAYKLSLAEQVQPQAVIVGSSRVLQFRPSYFSRRFVNMGSMASTMPQAEAIVRDLLQRADPELIIVALDFWWFNEEVSASFAGRQDDVVFAIRPTHIIEPFRWLYDDRVTVPQLISLFGRSDDGKCRIGLLAKLKNVGFGKRGSYYYVQTVTGTKVASDAGFRSTLNRIDKGLARFAHAQRVDEGAVASLARLDRLLRDRGKKVVYLLPPLAPAAWAKLASKGDDFAYVAELRDRMRRLGIRPLDYGADNVVATDGCEFVDGFHPGDVAVARILRDMAARRPDIASYLDQERIARVIRDGAGLAMFPDPEITDRPEIDFLKLGCAKKSAASQ